jgi:hypothetical protein
MRLGNVWYYILVDSTRDKLKSVKLTNACENVPPRILQEVAFILSNFK